MCPDNELLSAFVDGEIENPWKEKLESHLRNCAVCRERVAAFQKLSILLQEDPEPDSIPSMYRVKEKLEALPRAGRKVKAPFWKRRILIPVPIIAIAASVLIFLSTVISVTIANIKPAGNTKGTAEVAEKPVATDDELATIIKLMENKDFNNEIVIQLPEGSPFTMSGEPQFIRAKDLNRSK